MTRTASIAWTEARLTQLRGLAGTWNAFEIAERMGLTVEQVRGGAKRHAVALAPGPEARARRNAKIAEAMARAWKDDAKRQALRDGLARVNATDKERAHRAEAARKRWSDPEWRRQTRAAISASAHRRIRLQKVARRLVMESGAPLIRANVALAENLVARGAPETVVRATLALAVRP